MGGLTRILGAALMAAASVLVPMADAQAVPPARGEIGVKASLFDLSQVTLTDTSRWLDNQGRTLTYLKNVDMERLLYVFRNNHKLGTNGAATNGGWDAPDFPFRSHMQGHFLSAWSQCWASLQDTTCRDRAIYFTAELAKCQANNAAAGYAAGYLSGFPESEITAVEDRTLTSGNVPYYALHKTLAGLLDVWRHTGDATAKTVLLSLADWVDTRTSKLSYAKMQAMMGTEFGGMNDVLTEIYYWTGDSRYLAAAQRFDHAAVFDPLALNKDQLDGLHANTQVPKWIGAAREYKQTGNTKYLDIARNAWNITVGAHTYAIGGNSQSEHFRAPNAIAGYLNQDTAESCNSYNMLKLTRELWTIDPSASYFDFHERAVLNHLLGQQDPSSAHGHVTYFTPLNAGGKRGVGPAWGGGTWSTDYDSFWCCQGTGIETNTKYMDSIYGFDTSSLYVNLFIPSKLNWKQRNVMVSQTTTFPQSDTTTLTISGSSTFQLRIRIPSWTSSSGAKILVNGQAVSGTTLTPGTYATIASRAWQTGDTVTVTLPMALRLIGANDKPTTVAALAYGPVVLSGNYGTTALSGNPTLPLGSVVRKTGLNFQGTTSDGKTVDIGPFFDAQGFNYVVYWNVQGSLPT